MTRASLARSLTPIGMRTRPLSGYTRPQTQFRWILSPKIASEVNVLTDARRLVDIDAGLLDRRMSSTTPTFTSRNWSASSPAAGSSSATRPRYPTPATSSPPTWAMGEDPVLPSRASAHPRPGWRHSCLPQRLPMSPRQSRLPCRLRQLQRLRLRLPRLDLRQRRQTRRRPQPQGGLLRRTLRHQQMGPRPRSPTRYPPWPRLRHLRPHRSPSPGVLG